MSKTHFWPLQDMQISIMYSSFHVSNWIFIFTLYIGKGIPFQSKKSGDTRSKVKVKVNQNVKNTFLAITPVLIKIGTPNKKHFVSLKEPYHMGPWPWPLTLTLFLAPKVKVDLVWPFFDFFVFWSHQSMALRLF